MYYRVRIPVSSENVKAKDAVEAASASNAVSGDMRICLLKMSENEVELLLAVPFADLGRKGKLVSSFLSSLGITGEGKGGWEELDGRSYVSAVEDARRAKFISSVDEMAPGRRTYRRMPPSITDSILPPPVKKTLFTKGSVTLEEEIGRIRQSKTRGFYGHPVHYIFLMDSTDAVDESLSLLLNALVKKGRLVSRRVLRVSAPEEKEFIFNDLDFESLGLTAVRTAQGGTVVLLAGRSEEGEKRSAGDVDTDDIAKVIRSDTRNVLSVVVLPRSRQNDAVALMNALPEVRFVVINELDVPRSDISSSLGFWAKKDGLSRFLPSLMKTVPEERKSFTLSELGEIYSSWRGNLLSGELYPEYNTLPSIRVEVKEDRGSTYDTLQSLIGLSSVKDIINEVIDLNRYNAMLLSRNRKMIEVSRHMVFTGNPGTAKTTVARLFAKIMKENGILEGGDLIEVGRQDIVAKYVGWTAKNVEELFRRARGNVLFIDEAYSLVDDRDGSYGDEAINAIVQCMENQRNDTIVIFAGYPDKMEGFLSKNPGLRSRISRIVRFEDYTTPELSDILRLMCTRDGTAVDDGVWDRVGGIFDRALEKNDFGNGRFVRNLYESARTRAVSRVMKSGTFDEIVLTADDFTLPDTVAENTGRRRIGFGF